ncbi:MAG: type V CRISPR-associated endonuclease Cas1 [Candidatus Peribacteria bacterium]|nr:MAG: type V CRISPR-associated endonuclease Cas1 [Candidatus Peribacteria bacterium]
MLQFPDFDEKQVLFIESFDTKNISFENENLLIKDGDHIKTKVSLYKIFAIFLIGETTITSVLIRKFQEFGITLIMLKRNLLPYLVIGNHTEGNVILRKKQYEATEGEMLEIAKHIVHLKTRNQLKLLKNTRDKNEDLKKSISQAQTILMQIDDAPSYESLLGYEGNISKIFFQTYFQSIGWQRREPRTKRDIQNLLLDIGYTYLFHFIEALLRLYGFDNYYGVYHRTWYQRKSLALDIMEPFRCIIDKTLLKAYNLKQINRKDFKFQNGHYMLPWEHSKKYSRIFLEAIMSYKKEMFYFTKNYYKYVIKGREHFPEFEIC